MPSARNKRHSNTSSFSKHARIDNEKEIITDVVTEPPRALLAEGNLDPNVSTAACVPQSSLLSLTKALCPSVCPCDTSTQNIAGWHLAVPRTAS